METAQTTMLATLPMEPSAPTRRMAHWGLTPTGAVAGSAEELRRRAGLCSLIWGEVRRGRGQRGRHTWR